MRSFASRIVLSAFSFISIASFTSCNEDTILNANIVPAGDTINSIILPDTITIYTKTVMDDTAKTGDSIFISGMPIYHALGTVSSDPYFGKTTAGIYFQVVPPKLTYTFPVAPDSAFLILPYAGFTWGDTAALMSQSFNVHEVSDSFPQKKNYFNYSQVAYYPEVIGSTTISNYNTLKDSVQDLGTNKQAHVRIKLSSTFVDKIKNANPNTNLNTYANFFSYFKGFYIEPTSTTIGNALFYFQMTGAYASTNYNRANVLFYYTEGGTVKTASYYYDPSQAARYNKISKDYTSTPTGSLLGSTLTSDSLFIVQNEPGAAGEVILPYVKFLPQKPINKAELIITQYSFLGDASDRYLTPERIYPFRVNDDGTTEAILDRYPLGSTQPLIFMDGERKTTTIAGITFTQYKLNMPREIQKAITEQKDKLHLRIAGASGYPAAFRLIAGGSKMGQPNYSIRLNIVYTKI